MKEEGFQAQDAIKPEIEPPGNGFEVGFRIYMGISFFQETDQSDSGKEEEIKIGYLFDLESCGLQALAERFFAVPLPRVKRPVMFTEEDVERRVGDEDVASGLEDVVNSFQNENVISDVLVIKNIEHGDQIETLRLERQVVRV